jgi:hypothetical protein
MDAGRSSLGSIKIPYYVPLKGRGYWRPSARMKQLGFDDVRCGPDGPAAWAVAQYWNNRWQRVRRGLELPPNEAVAVTREEAEAARKYPAKSVGAAFQIFIRTEEWASKALSTRTKVWWPAWFRIRDMWGDVDPNTITFDMISTWRSDLEKAHGRSVAHKAIKIWRALWKVMLGLKYAAGADPSTGVRNKKPRARHQTWTEGEAVRLAKRAWREGYRGTACIIAICWDTLFSPADARTLTAKHIGTLPNGRMWFDRSEDGRQKTGRAAIGTISKRTERMIKRYLEDLPYGTTPKATLFRTRSGGPYREDTLSDDFAAIRELEFPGDKRKLMDLRRSGTVEAVVGSEGEDFSMKLSAKLANSIDTSNELQKTYSPANIIPVQDVDAARVRGRKRLRGENGNG